jgi:hypothetical protein
MSGQRSNFQMNPEGGRRPTCTGARTFGWVPPQPCFVLRSGRE